MKLWFFSLKQALLHPVFWIFLIGILVLPPLLFGVGERSGMPVGGYYLEDPSDADSQRMAELLETQKFIPYSDFQAMKKDVSEGVLDAGAVVMKNLTERLKTGDFEGSVVVFISPTSLYPELKQAEAASALFTTYAPYVTERALAETDISLEEIKDEFEKRVGNVEERLFTFNISYRSGKAVPASATGRRFFLGALALLLYLGTYFGVAMPLFDRFKSVSERVGRKAALRAYLLPGLLTRTVFFLAAAAGAVLVAGTPDYLLPATAYTLLLIALHSLFMLIPGMWKDIAVLFVAAFGLVLCPIYLDFSLLWNPIRFVRLPLPPYWLWLLAG